MSRPTDGVSTTIKGLGLATAFMPLGSLYTLSSATIPAILSTLDDPATSPSTAAKSAVVASKNSSSPIYYNQAISYYCFSTLAYYAYKLYPKHLFDLPKQVGPLTLKQGHLWCVYAAASLVMFAVVPFQYVVIKPIEQQLQRLADAGENVGSGEEGVKGWERQQVRSLLEKWSQRNMWRRVLVSSGGLLGLWAVLGF